jgi:glutamine---fructose-6-phosphate transaminase (isomerizing)
VEVNQHRPESGITDSLAKELNVVADLRVIEGGYLRDLLDQPRALEDTLATLDRSKPLLDLALRLNRAKFQRIVLTGMGSSFHVLHPLNLQLVSHGFTAIMVETSELIHYKARFFDPRTLIVAVSQSGQSAEMVRLAEVNHQRSAVIAVTNTPQSPLVQHATAALFTQAGSEFSVSCKTYVTALMALKWLGDILCQRDTRQSRRELKNAAPATAAYLADWKQYVTSLAERLSRIRHLFFVGRGASLAAVGTGALIVKESDHFHAEGMSSAAFRHGPLEMLSEDTFVVVFSGDDKTRALNLRLLADIQQGGGCAELVGETSSIECFRLADHASSVRPILEILPIQMITLALAARAGREPGRFELATKVTTTE